jgi:hypothetical protein
MASDFEECRRRIVGESMSKPGTPLDMQLGLLRRAGSELRILKREIALAIKEARRACRERKAKAKPGFFTSSGQAAYKRKQIQKASEAEITELQRDLHAVEQELLRLERETVEIGARNANASWGRAPPDWKEGGDARPTGDTLTGGVYLLRCGTFHKIGKATVFDDRIKRIELLQPEPVEVVHKLYAHDPDSLERYWHTRFVTKRRNGEWFELSAEDVEEFKKWGDAEPQQEEKSDQLRGSLLAKLFGYGSKG